MELSIGFSISPRYEVQFSFEHNAFAFCSKDFINQRFIHIDPLDHGLAHEANKNAGN
jgi:hypothetical protein